MEQGRNKLDSILGVGARELREKIEKRKRIEDKIKFNFNKTPARMYVELSKYVIGQDDALQKICNAVCYHYKGLSKGIETKEEQCTSNRTNWMRKNIYDRKSCPVSRCPSGNFRRNKIYCCRICRR